MSNALTQLQRAKDIVDRYYQRGRMFPREFRDCGRTDPVRQQGNYTYLQLHYNVFINSFMYAIIIEYRDACKVKTWKYSLLEKNRYTCSDEVRDYLDQNMPGWRDLHGRQGQSLSSQLSKARDIVQRYRERGCVRPRR